MAMEAKLNKRLFKIELLYLKILTILIAGLHFLNIVLTYFDYDNLLFSYLGSTGFLPLLFIYIASHTHGFCLYHRLFIFYIGVNNVICYIDYKYGFPVDNRMYLLLHLVISFAFLVVILYLREKHARTFKKINNKRTRCFT